MMIPTIASLSEDAMRSVAKGTKEASLALGATRLEMVKQVVFPSAFTGIMAAIILAASRAIGETMIVVIAAGSRRTYRSIRHNLFKR